MAKSGDSVADEAPSLKPSTCQSAGTGDLATGRVPQTHREIRLKTPVSRPSIQSTTPQDGGHVLLLKRHGCV